MKPHVIEDRAHLAGVPGGARPFNGGYIWTRPRGAPVVMAYADGVVATFGEGGPAEMDAETWVLSKSKIPDVELLAGQLKEMVKPVGHVCISQGYEARAAGKPITANPYNTECGSGKYWLQGYNKMPQPESKPRPNGVPADVDAREVGAGWVWAGKDGHAPVIRAFCAGAQKDFGFGPSSWESAEAWCFANSPKVVNEALMGAGLTTIKEPRPEGPKEHEIKCSPEYFDESEAGRKNFEIRLDDRDYRPGDMILQREWASPDSWQPSTSGYTGRKLRQLISYVTTFPVGLKAGYVCMAMQIVRDAYVEPKISGPLSGLDHLSEIARLKREVEVLRSYGNKDCTGMADTVLESEGAQTDQPGELADAKEKIAHQSEVLSEAKSTIQKLRDDYDTLATIVLGTPVKDIVRHLGQALVEKEATELVNDLYGEDHAEVQNPVAIAEKLAQEYPTLRGAFVALAKPNLNELTLDHRIVVPHEGLAAEIREKLDSEPHSALAIAYRIPPDGPWGWAEPGHWPNMTDEQGKSVIEEMRKRPLEPLSDDEKQELDKLLEPTKETP